jgi:hypothetical protein
MNTTTTKTLSTSPAAERARARRAAAKAAAQAAELATAAIDATLPATDATEAEEDTTPPSNPGVFAALAAALNPDAEAAEASEEAAIAAIAKARAPKAVTKTAQPKPALTALYRLGTYNGRAGAMFAFMARCGTLGDAFSRADVVASVEAKEVHPAVTTRAHALDYFAWAARHGLLVAVEAAPAVVAAKAAA